MARKGTSSWLPAKPARKVVRKHRNSGTGRRSEVRLSEERERLAAGTPGFVHRVVKS